MKRRFSDIQNLTLALKVLATSLITGVIWAIPIFLVRYILNAQNTIVGLTIGVVSFIGYLYTFGFLANKLFNIKD